MFARAAILVYSVVVLPVVALSQASSSTVRTQSWLMRHLYEASRVCQQQTGRFPSDFRELGGFLSERLRRQMPAAVQFHDPESADNRLRRLSPLGERTPCLRLKLDGDGGRWLNISCSGSFFESGLYWESEFVHLLPRSFAHPKLLARDWRPIPERAANRSSLCGPDQVNLVPRCDAIPSEPWFTGWRCDDGSGNDNSGGETIPPDFSNSLASGVYESGGILFDVRGVIQLDGKLSPKAEGARWIRSYPREVTGIIISRTVRQLHLLAGAIGRTEQLASVAILQLHFASGQTVELPLRYGEDIAAADDSFYGSPRLFPVAHARSIYETREVSYSLHHVCLVNPRPEDRIETIDFASGVTTSHPYILAITLEQ